MSIKDSQISRLKEQIALRDELLTEARTMMPAGDISKLRDSRIVSLEDICFESQLKSSSSKPNYHNPPSTTS